MAGVGNLQPISSMYALGAVSVALLCVLASSPPTFERNLPSIVVLSFAWILVELRKAAVFRSLVLAVSEGFVLHRLFCTVYPCSNSAHTFLYISFFACIQEESIFRLVCALAVFSYSVSALWKHTLQEAVQTRLLPAYWQPPIQSPTSPWRRDFGNLIQLVVTRRLYDMLNDTSKQELVMMNNHPKERNRFTMAVLTALSKQSTQRVLAAQHSNHVQAGVRRVAQFLERKVTHTAWKQLNKNTSFFSVALPRVLDPAGKGLMWFLLAFATTLIAHKKAFKWLKIKTHHIEHTEWLLFLLKQASRFALVFYLMARYVIGHPPPPPPPSTTSQDAETMVITVDEEE